MPLHASVPTWVNKWTKIFQTSNRTQTILFVSLKNYQPISILAPI